MKKIFSLKLIKRCSENQIGLREKITWVSFHEKANEAFVKVGDILTEKTYVCVNEVIVLVQNIIKNINQDIDTMVYNDFFELNLKENDLDK